MNLLPSTEKEALKKGLKNRFIIMSLILLTISSWIGIIMLLPPYFLILGNISKMEATNNSIGLKNQKVAEEILNLPNEINLKSKFIQSTNLNPSVITVLSKIIRSVPAKIIVNSISFSQNDVYKKRRGVLVLISGIAGDRNSLVAFSSSLENSKEFSLIDMPVSNLTKDRDFSFTMNIFIEK